MSENHHAALGIHGVAAPHHGPILRRAKWGSIFVVAALVVGAGVTVALRVSHAHALDSAVAEQARVLVATVNAKASKSTKSLTLPSTLQGKIEAPIYARSSGYVVRWTKDIGSHVAQGDILAEIDTPEVDQQLAQAVAARLQAVSSLDLAKSSAERWEALRKKDAVTQQELNERVSAYTQAQANLGSADANLRRLQKLEEFKKVTAPFAGVITHRAVEVGDLIDAGNGGAGRALFTMAQVDTLRAYVYAPQAYAQSIRVGDTVNITQTELPNQVFHGVVVRNAGAIDVATRTMQMEVSLPNRDGKLLAGTYVQIELPISGVAAVLVVPSNVLLFRPDGPRIAVVGDDGHVQLRTVTLGHDLGSTQEILNGISAKDKLIVNPPDSLAENDVVTVVEPKTVATVSGKASAP